MKRTLDLDNARMLADLIVQEVAPYCSRVEVAGSIRRGCRQVHDVDLVCIPHSPTALWARFTRRSTSILQGTKIWRFETRHQVQLDVYLAEDREPELFDARPSNWGSAMVLRTGSAGHNIWLVERAKRMGMQWHTEFGVYDPRGEFLAGETEAEIFAALGLPYIEPAERIGSLSAERYPLEAIYA